MKIGKTERKQIKDEKRRIITNNKHEVKKLEENREKINENWERNDLKLQHSAAEKIKRAQRAVLESQKKTDERIDVSWIHVVSVAWMKKLILLDLWKK